MIKIDFKKRTSVICLTTLALISSSLVIPSSAQADVIQETECFPAVLMLKGSGEGNTNEGPVDPKDYVPINSTTQKPFIHTNGHEGAVLGRLLQGFVNETDPLQTVSKVRFIGLTTPSLPVEPEIPVTPPPPLGATQPQGDVRSDVMLAWTKHLFDYNASYNDGAQAVVDFIQKDEQRGCNTQYMLLSYSQGVISARLAMSLLDNNTDKVISSYVMGDPFQKSNGAESSRHKTAANTSPDTDGIARVALDKMVGISFSKIKSLVQYRDDIIGSDPFIYRDEGENNIVSRSLCHENDPTCDFAMFATDPNQHTNYFDVGIPAGASDLLLEVPEFDKQIRILANSTAANLRQRTLKKTPSVLGSSTTYNVANARPDDLCSWDEDSDDSKEAVEIPCGTYKIKHTSEIEKMTVHVKDSFGIAYTGKIETQAVDPKIVDTVSNLNPNSWYQFKAYQEPPTEKDENYGWYYDENGEWVRDEDWRPREEQCIEWSQSASDYIDENSRNSLELSHCYGDPSDKRAWDSLSVFKASPYQTPEGRKIRVLSGYDDDYSWVSSDNPFNEIKLNKTSLDEKQNFEPKLSRVISDVPYYIFKQDNQCLTKVEEDVYYSYIETQDCDSHNKRQLFSAITVSGNFGSLSVEKDFTAPTDPSDLKIEIDLDKINFKWKLSEDPERAMVSIYHIYKKDNETGELVYVDNIRHYNIYKLDLGNALPNEMHTYEIIAVDDAGNRSLSKSITFVTPPKVSKIEPPTLVAKTSTSVTIRVPNYDKNSVRGVRIYRNGNYLSTIKGNEYTAPYVSWQNNTYSYQLEISDNVSSVESYYLRVN